MSRFVAIAVLGLGLAALAAADDKKPAEKKPDPPKADWSAFASAGEVSGEVVKAEEEELTLRVYWQAPGKRPSLFRPQAPKDKYTDYRLKFADASLVRWKTLPPKGTDEKGKPIPFTEKERAERRKPSGAPGYAAERGDLQPGHRVDVTLVRPKEVPADKAVVQDLRVKYAVITGGESKAAPPEKDKKKKDK
jgi:hypothetical protein